MTNTIDHQALFAACPWPELLAGRGLTVSSDGVSAPNGAVARLETGPTGALGLSHTEAGRTVRLTSAVNPVAEDQNLVARLAPKAGAGGVLCLGLGLGYQLEALAERLGPEEPLWVFESRPELAAVALMSRDFLSPLLARPGFRLFVGPWAEGEKPFADEELPATQVLWRPATARYFSGEYPWFAAPLPPASPRPAPRLLLFQSGYYLDRELTNAARSLGLETAIWNFQRGESADGSNYRELLELIKNFRPDLALTVNHLGFDADGLLDDLLARLGLPAASWFVDSPAFILGETSPGRTVSAFSWDRDYLTLLKDKGFARVHYLPLATDPSFFSASAQAAPTLPLAFVGDSLTMATAKYMLKLGLRAESKKFSGFLDRADKLGELFLATSDLLPDVAALEKLAAWAELELTPERMSDLGALITWRASRLRRGHILRELKDCGLTVVGDRHWASLLNLEPKRLRAPLEYYGELAPFYQSAQVNLNITSAQMKTGLNQRVFDVPAAGAFLLTDYREQLFELFEPDREVITYQGPREARSLARWYAERPAARESVTRAAHRRVTGCHLYTHRLRELLKTMEL